MTAQPGRDGNLRRRGGPHRTQVLVLGAGSNIVVGDAGFDSRVIRSAATGRSVAARDAWVELTAEAGATWAAPVETSVADNLAGIECLATIPGSVGAVSVQNVGAYGQEVAATTCRVEVWDRHRNRLACLDGPACWFGYRNSRFKTDDRFVGVSVSFRLRRSSPSQPVRYPQLAEPLGKPLGHPWPARCARPCTTPSP